MVGLDRGVQVSSSEKIADSLEMVRAIPNSDVE